MTERPIVARIREDLAEKMVFLAGPRQVGKTSVAKTVLAKATRGVYLTWDRREDRRAVLAAAWPPAPATVVLDEFHKYRHWKRWLKGEYDTLGPQLRFLVTGSARLDVYRKGGDSLLGRYHHHRLHPFTAGELAGEEPSAVPFDALPFGRGTDAVEALLERGGFPEPFFAATTRAHRRWQHERIERLFREDVRDLESVRDLSSMQLLADLLPERVGSTLSRNALREDLSVSHGAVTRWLDVLERLYFAYRVPPWAASLARTLRKEPKLYLWDWSAVEAPGPRFENMVASHLLKLCHHLEDVEGHAARLTYLRDKERREVDFVVTIKGRPWFAVEARVGDDAPSPHLRYFGERLRIPYLYQVVLGAHRDYVRDGVHVVAASRFLPAVA